MQLLNNRDIDRNMCCAAARQTLRTPLFRDQAPLGAQTTKRHTDQTWLGCQNGTKQHVQNTLEICATYCKTKKQQLVTSPKHMPNSKPLISSVFCNDFRTRGIDTNDGCKNTVGFCVDLGKPRRPCPPTNNIHSVWWTRNRDKIHLHN